MSLGMAGAAASVMQVSGIAGGLLWGILLNRGFAFKPILVTPIVLILSGALGTSFITGGILLYVSAFLVGMGYYAFQAASLTVIMQLPGMEPQMMGGATAIYMGLGSLIGIAAPGLFDAIQETNGMQAAMTVFSMLPVLSLAAICVYRDSRTRNEA